VVIVEEDDEAAAAARSDGYTVVIGDGTDTDVLREAGIENARIVVAATGDDTTNLLVAQLVSSRFEVPEIFARANDPDNVEAFEELGVKTISSSMAAAWAIDNQIERPALANWMNDVDRVGDVQEVELQNESVAGLSIAELGPKLPDGCLVVLVGRDGESAVPSAADTVELGDHLTLVGTHDGVREGMTLLRG
jgi:Trk K+ transport system NAD-binding subunit